MSPFCRKDAKKETLTLARLFALGLIALPIIEIALSLIHI